LGRRDEASTRPFSRRRLRRPTLRLYALLLLLPIEKLAVKSLQRFNILEAHGCCPIAKIVGDPLRRHSSEHTIPCLLQPKNGLAAVPRDAVAQLEG